MSIDPILSALRALQYSSAKLADLITVGIADAEVRAQVREACLLELRWVDDLVGGESAARDVASVVVTEAQRAALEEARESYAAYPDHVGCAKIVAALDAVLERTAKGGGA